MTLPTLFDIGRHPNFECSEADIVGSRCRPMSENVGSVIFESGVVENVGVAYRIASLCLFIQKLCKLACLASATLKFHVARHVTWSILSAFGFLLVQYCVDNCFEQRQYFVNVFEWFCGWVNAIFSKMPILYGFSLLSPSHVTGNVDFFNMIREGSSTWTKRYITLADMLPNKNVRRGGFRPHPPCTFAWQKLTCRPTCEC